MNMKKSTRFFFSLILFVLLLASIAPPSGSAQQKEVPVGGQSAAPTGTYVPEARGSTSWDPFSSRPTNSVPLFTLRLETNGTYVAEVLHPPRNLFNDYGRRPEVARGTWRWDAQKREFELAPGDFTFYIRRLPQDKRNPNRLLWGHSFLERQENK
jgi:hypothetical protein